MNLRSLFIFIYTLRRLSSSSSIIEFDTFFKRMKDVYLTKKNSSIHSYRHVHTLRWENDVPLLKCYWTFTCSSACYDILPECASFITSPEECRASAFLTKYCRMSCSLCGKCFLFLFLFFFYTIKVYSVASKIM